MKTFLKYFLWVLACIAIAGCASTKEEKKKTDHKVLVAPIRKPEKIYIREFDADFSKIGSNVSDEELKTFKKTVSDMTSFAIMEGLFKKLMSAQRLGPNDPAPTGNYWIIKGRLTNITQDNRSLRAFMNWGSGGKPTEAVVWIYNSNKSNVLPFAEFPTSNSPAAGISSTGMIPVMTEDADRLGDIISDRLTRAINKLPEAQKSAPASAKAAGKK
ncbi:MAG: DUF4410 domain-containing protein [bacterium]